MILSDSFKVRLKDAMAGESNNSFAKKCGLSEGTLRRYLLGNTFPPLDTLEKIAVASGCSLAWLASGEGEMKPIEVVNYEVPFTRREETAPKGVLKHETLLGGKPTVTRKRDDEDMITLDGLYPGRHKYAQPDVNEEKGVGVECSPEVAELAVLLENHAGKSLKENLKAILLKIKEMSEGIS